MIELRVTQDELDMLIDDVSASSNEMAGGIALLTIVILNTKEMGSTNACEAREALNRYLNGQNLLIKLWMADKPSEARDKAINDCKENVSITGRLLVKL